MQTTKFSAPDIVCDGCVEAIQNAVGRMGGVRSVDVDIEAKTITVAHDDNVSPEAIAQTLDTAGFPTGSDGRLMAAETSG